MDIVLSFHGYGEIRLHRAKTNFLSWNSIAPADVVPGGFPSLLPECAHELMISYCDSPVGT